ncbi:replicative DNA helicase [Mesomycoplasma conjunctivae]|uniref:replicative DNA helicase n=1 Tax=Mesomycoplasma conjunctivae TaxID=45361 RepID=UPI003DA48B7D
METKFKPLKMSNHRYNAPDIERIILTYFLRRPDKVHRYINLLSEEDFSDKQLSIIFLAIKKLMNNNGSFSVELLIEHLRSYGKLELIGGLPTIANLSKSFLVFDNTIEQYIKIVTEKTALRNLKKLLEESLKNIDNSTLSSSDLSSHLQSQINQINYANTSDNFTSVSSVSSEILDYLVQNRNRDSFKGLSTGYTNIDNTTSGLQPGELIILAARPSVGKTAFALNIARNVCANKKSVLFFSLEMSDKDLVTRILSLETNIDSALFKTPKYLKEEQFEIITSAINHQIANYQMLINDSGSINIDDIYWQVWKRFKNNEKFDLIILDYLQLINSSQKQRSDSRQVEVSIISRKLKQLARDVNVPIIALSQLSRSVEKREDKLPMLSDLRESGAIEQDADIVAFLYRADYYNKQKGSEEISDDSPTQLRIAKNRSGPTGILDFIFIPRQGLFVEQEWNGDSDE